MERFLWRFRLISLSVLTVMVSSILLITMCLTNSTPLTKKSSSRSVTLLTKNMESSVQTVMIPSMKYFLSTRTSQLPVELSTNDDHRGDDPIIVVPSGDRDLLHSPSVCDLVGKQIMDKDQLRDLIIKVLKEVNLHSDSAVELLMLTAATESNLGEYIRQVRGPALGIFQMEPFTHDDIWRTHNSKLVDLLGDQDSGKLVYDLKYAIIMTRMHYLRIPSALPPATDIQSQAEYWKKYYNTHLGSGTIAKAKAKYTAYVLT